MLPSGDFLAARMILYLGCGLSCQQALDMKFSESRAHRDDFPLNQIDIALDDALLESLVKLWRKSGESEEFNWVFGEYGNSLWRDENRSSKEAQRYHGIVQALSPGELMALDDTRGKHFIFARKVEVAEAKDVECWQPFLGGIPGDTYERSRSSVRIPDDDEAGEWLYKTVGTDGPINAMIHSNSGFATTYPGREGIV
ncbi:hypothetical protein FHETE_4035 [Fusarium heterosporum]|uniref:Uncharacterized protein n=1 Tax=Fusarium heterosporum TaxID=42747 RepID=A0A8H5TG91_FUSHE|nr:hypothetical protein FHETE_4035 [Fusarium heterosporum]